MAAVNDQPGKEAEISMVSLVEMPQIVNAIGLVTLRWASVDRELANILGIILQNEEAGMSCIFDGTDSGVKRFEAFIGIVGSSSLAEADRKILIEGAQSLKNLLSERNRIVHSPLVLSAYVDGEKFGMRLERIGKRTKAERSRFKAVTIESILSHADQVHTRANVLLNWWLKNRP